MDQRAAELFYPGEEAGEGVASTLSHHRGQLAGSGRIDFDASGLLLARAFVTSKIGTVGRWVAGRWLDKLGKARQGKA